MIRHAAVLALLVAGGVVALGACSPSGPRQGSTPTPRVIPPTSTLAPGETRPTDRWAVRLREGADPDSVARDHKAENLGPVAQVPRLYLFRRPDRARSDTGPDPLAADPRVEWIERQVETRVFPEAP